MGLGGGQKGLGWTGLGIRLRNGRSMIPKALGEVVTIILLLLLVNTSYFLIYNNIITSSQKPRLVLDTAKQSDFDGRRRGMNACELYLGTLSTLSHPSTLDKRHNTTSSLSPDYTDAVTGPQCTPSLSAQQGGPTC